VHSNQCGYNMRCYSRREEVPLVSRLGAVLTFPRPFCLEVVLAGGRLDRNTSDRRRMTLTRPGVAYGESSCHGGTATTGSDIAGVDVGRFAAERPTDKGSIDICSRRRCSAATAPQHGAQQQYAGSVTLTADVGG